MEDAAPGIRRLCLAYGTDLPAGTGPGGNDGPQDEGIQAFADACRSVGLNRILLQRHGTGQVGVLPTGIDEPRVVMSLIAEVARVTAALSVRIMLAFHEGITTLEASGFGGNAVAKVRRLAASPPLRAALAEAPGARLAVMLSDPVFEGSSTHPAACQFRPVQVDGSGPAAPDQAWIFIPEGQRAGQG